MPRERMLMGVGADLLMKVLAWKAMPALMRWSSLAYAPWPHLRLSQFAGQRDAYLARMPSDLNPVLLDRMLAVDREVVARVTSDDPERATYLWQLSLDLRSRYLLQSDPQDLDEAIHAGRAAIAAAGSDHRNMARYLHDVAVSLAVLHEDRPDVVALDEAISLMIATLRRIDLADESLAEGVGFHCALLQERIGLGPTPTVAAALNATEQLLPRLPAELTTDPLAMVGSALRVTALSTTEERLVAEFTTFARAVVAQFSPADRNWPNHVANLAALLFILALANGDPDLIRESASLRREIVDRTSIDDPALSERLDSWGNASTVRYELTADVEGIDEAVIAYRRGVTLVPHNTPERRTHLRGLADALRLRFHHNADMAALSEAVAVVRDAIHHLGPEDSDPALLNQVAITLEASFSASGRIDELAEAVRLGRRAVATAPNGDPDRLLYQANLCHFLFRLNSVNGDSDLIAEAIAAGREATAAKRHALHYGLSNLADALIVRYAVNGDVAALDEAVTLGRQAVAAVSGTHRRTPDYLSSLARYLLLRYVRSGNPPDLDESIELHRQAHALSPPGGPGKRMLAWGIGNALQLRAVAELNDSALGEARDLLRDLVDKTPSDDPHRDLYLLDLAGTMWLWFDRYKDPDALDEGVSAAREAVAKTQAGTLRRTYAHSNLAILLMGRFAVKGDRADIDTAVATAETVVAMIAPGAPNHAVARQNLGEVLHARFTGLGDRADHDAAIVALREAVAAGPGEVRTVVAHVIPRVCAHGIPQGVGLWGCST